MGKVHHGIPKELALQLRDDYNLTAFVETGTQKGRTTHWAAKHFEQVYTVEVSRHWYGIMRKKKKPNVRIWFGDSGRTLPVMLKQVQDLALIWLDAHWNATSQFPCPESGECPVREEIAAINEDGRSHVILIDDARYFTEQLPPPRDPAQWPTIEELKICLSPRTVWVKDDVIIAVHGGN